MPYLWPPSLDICFPPLQANSYGGMTYAQYARSGFFQLCAVCAINGCVIAAAHFTGKERNGSRLKRPVIVMCLLSLLLLCTAGAKMAMYIAAYGLTPKRIISSLFLLWLMLVFAGIIVSRYRQFNLVKFLSLPLWQCLNLSFALIYRP